VTSTQSLAKNIIVKFADDTTVVVPEKTDVSLPEKFDHINVWATVNRMILNLIKTKEIVFHRPGPKNLHMFPSLESIELVEQAKLLGVILQNNFSVNSHVNYVLTLCSQRIFLLKRLRDQGLNYRQLDTVFQAIVVSRILYALPGWGPFLIKNLQEELMPFSKEHIDTALLLKFWR